MLQQVEALHLLGLVLRTEVYTNTGVPNVVITDCGLERAILQLTNCRLQSL